MPSARRQAICACALTLAVSAPALAGCSQKSAADAPGAVKITATDTECKVSRKSFDAGHVTLAVENKGKQVTEVYVYAAGDRIVAERENIGPGTTADLTTEVKAGAYEIACKPGMKGDGIRQRVTAGKAAPRKRDPRLAEAVAEYRKYVLAQAELTVPEAERFAAAIRAGDVARAKDLYASSRIGWERTEPVAESFGDIDPKVDVREDGLEQGQKEWTGWHRLEKSLWAAKKITAADKKYADRLVADLKDWRKRVGSAELTPTAMANGAKELLDEVATGKVTGEEDRYSHTDLSDFNANVEGAKKAYELLREVAAENDKALTQTLDKEFAGIEAELQKYRKGDGFVSYETVGQDRRKELSDSVNSLAEPLSKLAAAVVGH